ncbi:HU family DNA-binding protein [Mycoplasma wenyonii]|uniref:HU family DNA-binding protein n=1 Tax=Mycoplasma wenyonii TaxID=65123 RepID=A0A328PN04_9MOLU|nr:HU family DNA-binding protein [Mycoplasma wenyonii]RAO95095.1 HU family DNA-binding protein [Mycoplasma wenyonii]
MKKKDLLEAIANKVGCTHKTAQSVLREFQYFSIQELKKEGSVSLLGVGTLKISKRSARTGINPATKMKIQIPAKEVPRLVPSKKLKDIVSGKVTDIYATFEY